jgi:CDP-diacylglycerol pyrophosphatase
MLRPLLAVVLMAGMLAIVGGDAYAGLDGAIARCRSGADQECRVAPGFVLLKDFCGPTQLLLVASREPFITGIEDPSAAASDAPNYWRAAWIEGALGIFPKIIGKSLSLDEIGLAVNPPGRRSENILHIHIDKVAPAITVQLRAHHGESTFAVVDERHGATYAVSHLPNLDANLFRQVADKVGTREMARHTLVVIGDPEGGFFLLDAQGSGAAAPRGEDLLVEHGDCRRTGWGFAAAFR